MLDGDVVRRVNGFELNSPEKRARGHAWPRDATRIDIEHERNASAIRKSYGIR